MKPIKFGELKVGDILVHVDVLEPELFDFDDAFDPDYVIGIFYI